MEQRPDELTYMGLDVSLRSPGLALVDGAGTLLHVESPQITTRDAARLLELREHVRRVATTRPVSFALVEGYSFDSTHRALDVGEGGGVAKLALQELGIEHATPPPSLVKKFGTGNGSADKAAMIDAAQRLSGATMANDDQADAVVLAYMALALRTPSYRGARAQLEALKALRELGARRLTTRARVPRRSLRERF